MLSGFQAVVFVLAAGHTLADPFPEGPDKDQPLIDSLDEFVENVHSRVLDSTGYERLRVVVNTSGEVLEFFKFMGYLLLNGTLGECVAVDETPNNTKCVIHINPNRSKFGDAVTDFLAKDRAENLKDFEDFPLLVLPERGLAWNANTYLLRSYLKWIFSGTWNFFDHMQAHIAEVHPVYIGIGRLGELPWKCSTFVADVNTSIGDDTLKALIELVGPGCDNLENSPSSWLFKDELQNECEAFADEHGFIGGTSNRCLHKFVVRYNNYSAEAYESFEGHVAKYLYWDTIAHGLCLSIDYYGKLVDAAEADRRRAWTSENLASTGDWLLEVDSVLAETPPPYWIVEAKRVMENAVGNETVPYLSSADAARLYKAIHNGFQASVRGIPALRIKNISDSTIDVLVYYPAYDSTDHCYRNLTDVILSGQFSGVNYIVSLREGHVPSWVTTNNATMERDSREQDQCDRIDAVDRKMENKLTSSDGLRAVIAVKCARRFVWYELGYQYFPAAYTEAPMVQIQQASTYSSNCGMLVLFP